MRPCGMDPPPPYRNTPQTDSVMFHTRQVTDDLLVRYANSKAPTAVLLCIHGWTLDHRSFERQLPLTEHGINLLTFDRRGFGKNSSNPDTDLDLSDVHHLVLTSDLPVILYGVSQGARLALRYAQVYPKRLKGLIFQGGLADSCAFDPSSEDEPPLTQYRKLVQNNELENLRDHWVRHPLMRAGLSDKDTTILREQLNDYQGLDLLTPETKTLFSLPKTKRETLDVPMLITVAEQDSKQRKFHAESLLRSRNASALRSEGGHLCNFSHHEGFNRDVLSWIRTLGL